MVASVCGPRGQRAVRRVGLEPNQETEHVRILSLPAMDCIAQGTIVRQRAVKSLPALVNNA